MPRRRRAPNVRRMPGRARGGVHFAEPLIFERGREGRSGASSPALDVPAADPKALFGDAYRSEAPLLPEVSEPEAFRHYVRLSQQNFSIDGNMYPLGSCTMKYNPKVNEWAARLAGFRESCIRTRRTTLVQGALELMWRLERGLAEVCGHGSRLAPPAAGAQGELTGLMMIRAYHQAQGRDPKKVLIPDTAHGTNPASCALNGLKAVPFPVGRSTGIVTTEALAPYVDDDVAAIMAHQPEHGRPLRERTSRHRRAHSQQGRARLRRRRQPQRAHGQGAPGRPRHRRHAVQPAQDVHHAARRRRPRLWPGGIQEDSARRPSRPSPVGRKDATTAPTSSSTTRAVPDSVGRLRAFFRATSG